VREQRSPYAVTISTTPSFGARELRVPDEYWIVRSTRPLRHAVATVVAWLKQQAT
jgi:hypothetical protein